MRKVWVNELLKTNNKCSNKEEPNPFLIPKLVLKIHGHVNELPKNGNFAKKQKTTAKF